MFYHPSMTLALAASSLLSLTFCSSAMSGESSNTSATTEFVPQPADQARVPEGFKIEKIFDVPKSMGSWVALTTDAAGRLIASDEKNEGLYLIVPGNGEQPTRVQKLPVELSGAQGLLWAFDSLYVVINQGGKSGLYRATDNNGDGLVDSSQLCMPLQGGGEHGPHAVILSPDGKSLYVAAGNHTKLPEKLAGSRIPQNWQEDLLLPRRWDANGHAAGILAPGGWICNVDPEGKEWTVVSMGYRNQYDIAFNADGELFSYDADMEWDFGSPWYRPTRVVHATSGSEFGWRSGTGKWPEYYADSLSPAMNIGPGSPTGIVFGYGTKFPEKYQKALYILDWTYSTIYSVQLTPNGSSYQGKFEDFVTGSPLPVTDAVVGHDGTFYFTAGGRGTQSSLYRVSYQGEESTQAAQASNQDGSGQRQLRHRLESLHQTSATAWSDDQMQTVLKHLDDSDRFVRYAARIALEFQPVASWREQVLSLSQPRAQIYGLLALARQGQADDLNRIVDRLLGLAHHELSEEDTLAALRTLQVALARLDRDRQALRPDLKQQLVDALQSAYPAESHSINAEVVQLLVYLESPLVVKKTLDLMQQLGAEPVPDWGYLVSRNEGYGGTVGSMLANMPPVRGIHFAFVLRNAKVGWSVEDRRRYFSFFIEAAKHPGGASYGKFLEQFREDALLTCTEAEKLAVEDLVNHTLLAPPFAATPPKGPGRKWTTSEAVAELGEKLRKRDFDKGRNLYHATGCAKCHRLAGEGGAIGPDLSTAGKKFSFTDLVDAIVQPNRVISDQYGSHQVVTADGEILVGRAVEIDQELHVYLADVNAKPVVLNKQDVESITPSKVSQMPEGLIDSLSPDELRDLIAYITTAGDRRAIEFKQ